MNYNLSHFQELCYFWSHNTKFKLLFRLAITQHLELLSFAFNIHNANYAHTPKMQFIQFDLVISFFNTIMIVSLLP